MASKKQPFIPPGTLPRDVYELIPTLVAAAILVAAVLGIERLTGSRALGGIGIALGLVVGTRARRLGARWRAWSEARYQRVER